MVRYIDMTFSDSFSSFVKDAHVGEALNAVQSISRMKDTFSQYVVRPLNAFGLGGFIFDVEGDATHKLESDITDHWTEDNSPVQDHIAIKPVVITLKNYVGELVYREDKTTNTSIQKLTQKLTLLNNYLPQLSDAAQQAKNILQGNFDFDSISSVALNKATDLWALSKTLAPPVTRQQQAYLFFKALWQQKLLVSVQTPFEFLNNMAIMSVVAKQDEETKYMSTFTITLKQIRTVATKTQRNPALDLVGPVPQAKNPSESPADYQGGGRLQRQVSVNNGSSQGSVVSSTASDDLLEESGWINDDSAIPE